ncbi:uncharacterized protein LOC124811588 [Hydra vulgaris]|uniref:uncharacterized protein LOC124811588 n=1 Tax=Hydra vulgaris TaxID=6087 RepID=UPI001F5F2A06|nr:uncharacterized protein LOC124811588 [Hydra vulgaris]XP_047133432.1 uncharacterized protein LOC124811588 [Hydra vulgaris]
MRDETTEAITEALMCIKKWNPLFQPKFVLTDYSNEEINSLEYVFPGSNVLICDFHREQAWERWLSKITNGCSSVKEVVKLKLRQIANSKTEEICINAVNAFKESEEWKNHPKLREYLKNTWLCNQKRWVFAFRQHRLLRNVNTNNGTERQNQSLKYSFLEKRKNSSLTAMLSVCIDEFLPHNYNNYADKNRRAHSSYRKYNSKIPVYLINHPQPLVKHCMNMIDKLQGLDLEGINAVTDRLYNVASFQSNSREIYQFFLGDAKHLPSCSCPSWFSSIYPCKHIFAVFSKENLSWSDFDPSYGNSPYFILDPLLNKNNYSTSFHCQDLPETVNLSFKKNPLDNAKVVSDNSEFVPSEHCQTLPNINHIQASHHTPAACCELLNEIIKLTHLSKSQTATDNLFEGLYKLKLVSLMFEQSAMRNHLLKCLLNNRLDVFPTAINPSISKRCLAKTFHLLLHCSCRMFWTLEDEHIFNRQMAECSTCCKWFHRECEKIPPTAYVIWNCHECHRQASQR